jgi:hypothetical protein
MQKSVLALLISVVVSAGLVGEWYLRNRGYPVFDAAKYFIDCLEHYSRYRDSGWTSFLSQLFRTGDPPLFMNALGGIALVATGALPGICGVRFFALSESAFPVPSMFGFDFFEQSSLGAQMVGDF